MKLPLGFGGLVEGLRRSTVVVSGQRGSLGSGVIVDAEGSIITNDHIVRSVHLEVQLWDGRALRAEVQARDQYAVWDQHRGYNPIRNSPRATPAARWRTQRDGWWASTA
jgi:hypothetical protein